MADRTSSSEAEGFDDEKNGGRSPAGSFVKIKPMEDLEGGSNIERADLLPTANQPSQTPEKSTARAAVIWMVVNTLATIGIVRDTPPLRDPTDPQKL
jgi:hypothetical protein